MGIERFTGEMAQNGSKSALHRGVWSALHRGGRERAPQGGTERAPQGGCGVLDSPNPSVMFPNSIGLEPVGSVHFRAPAGPSRAGAVERGADDNRGVRPPKKLVKIEKTDLKFS